MAISFSTIKEQVVTITQDLDLEDCRMLVQLQALHQKHYQYETFIHFKLLVQYNVY